jgi:hypothetical protein
MYNYKAIKKASYHVTALKMTVYQKISLAKAPPPLTKFAVMVISRG